MQITFRHINKVITCEKQHLSRDTPEHYHQHQKA